MCAPSTSHSRSWRPSPIRCRSISPSVGSQRYGSSTVCACVAVAHQQPVVARSLGHHARTTARRRAPGPAAYPARVPPTSTDTSSACGRSARTTVPSAMRVRAQHPVRVVVGPTEHAVRPCPGRAGQGVDRLGLRVRRRSDAANLRCRRRHGSRGCTWHDRSVRLDEDRAPRHVATAGSGRALRAARSRPLVDRSTAGSAAHVGPAAGLVDDLVHGLVQLERAQQRAVVARVGAGPQGVAVAEGVAVAGRPLARVPEQRRRRGPVVGEALAGPTPAAGRTRRSRTSGASRRRRASASRGRAAVRERRRRLALEVEDQPAVRGAQQLARGAGRRARAGPAPARAASATAS